MADIELVIKIPEEIRLALINNIQLSPDQKFIKDSCINHAIINGTLLPEDHGRLIDADKFHRTLEDMPIRTNDKWFNWLQRVCIRLGEMPTIIEADRAESEE